MRTLRAFALGLIVVAASHAAGKGDAGSNAVDFLRLGAGASAAAQGEAYAGRSGDIEVLSYNPAGLRHVERHEIMLQHNNYIHDLSSEYLAGVYKFRNGWALGGSLTYFDQGRQTRRTITNPTGLGTFTADATIGAIGVSIPLWRDFSAGITTKIFNEQIDDADRTSVAWDLGLHYTNPSRRFEIGGVIRNLGPDVKFDVTEEELPLEYAIGGSVKVIDRLRISGEAVAPRNQEAEYRVGADLRLHRMLAVRAGYNTRNDAGSGLSLGAGFRYQNIDLDYAWVGFSELGDAHRVGLSVGLGALDERRTEVDMEPEPVRIAAPRTEPARVVKPVRAEPVLSGRGLVALPFADQSQASGNEWIGAAAAEVLNDDWRRRDALNTNVDLARYVIDGDFWVIDQTLSFTARISDRSNANEPKVYRASVTGELSEPYAVWQNLRLKVNQVLAAQGVAGLNLSPVEARNVMRVPDAAPAPVKVVPVTPEATRSGISIAVRQYGYSSPTTVVRDLGRAGERALEDRGISTDPRTNAYRLDAQVAELDATNAVVYGNIVDRTTGIPVAKVEVYGSLSDMPSFAEKIADAVALKLPRK